MANTFQAPYAVPRTLYFSAAPGTMPGARQLEITPLTALDGSNATVSLITRALDSIGFFVSREDFGEGDDVRLITAGSLALTPLPNYQGLWWAAGGTEAYWGINFAHQGDQLFGTWYTYDTTGRPWWLSLRATRTTPTSNVYSGPIYVNHGPPFNNFVGTGVPTQIGIATITFSDANNGIFAYTINATTQTKAIARFDLGTGMYPTCTYSTTAPNYAAARNYQDLWWVGDGSESGWGINFADQGGMLGFATWYTYDVDGAPLWLSVLLERDWFEIDGVQYAGTLYRTSGPRFDAYDQSQAVMTQVGWAWFLFSDGTHATFQYTTNGNGGLPAVTQTKTLSRYIFAAPGGTLCEIPPEAW